MVILMQQHFITPRFRVEEPHLCKAVPSPGIRGRYTCTAVFTPSEFNDQDKARFQALVAACNHVSLETFDKPMRELDRSVYKTPFLQGEDAAVFSISLSAYSRRPCVIDVGGAELFPADLYPGCYARASVNPFANRQRKSIAISLHHLQKLGDAVVAAERAS
jgi:hypothetical protein